MEEDENLDAFPARGPVLRKTKKRHKLLRKNSEQRQKLFKIAMDKNQTKPEVFSKLEEELRSLPSEEKLKLVQEVDDRGNTALHYATKGRIPLPNRMNFWKSAKGGGVIFNSKIYIADFGNFKQGFLSMKLIKMIKRRVISGFRVCFFNNCVDIY